MASPRSSGHISPHSLYVPDHPASVPPAARGTAGVVPRAGGLLAGQGGAAPTGALPGLGLQPGAPRALAAAICGNYFKL